MTVKEGTGDSSSYEHKDVFCHGVLVCRGCKVLSTLGRQWSVYT